MMNRTLKNIEIITAFKNNTASQALLKDYSGWGGLRKSIYNSTVYRELKKVLKPDEIISLKQTLNSAYYTPDILVKFMYEWLFIYGFKGGSILEPARRTRRFYRAYASSYKRK